jgi:hypothetical protein
MSGIPVQTPFPIFNDIDGQPLEAGYIFVGVANLDPQVNPVAVFFDEALTQPAGQPIRTIGGYAVNSGTPTNLYSGSNYSIRVTNKNGSVIYSAPVAQSYLTLTSDLAAAGPGKGANLVGFIQAGAGAVATTVDAKLKGIISVKDFGAIGDGTTDDTGAIAAALLTGRVVSFPEGTYLTGPIVVNTFQGLRIYGSSKYGTTIKLKNGSNDHLISFVTGAASCSIRGITLDQNSDNQSGGHGVRLGGVNGLVMDDFIIKNCRTYGIGTQAGTNKNVKITNFELDRIGEDGIDIKDFNFDNENIIIADGSIRNFGYLQTLKVGIDIRGPALVSNIVGIMQNTNSRGLLRLRSASVQGRHGQGSFSNLTADGTLGTDCVALWVEPGVTNFAISNVSMCGGALGVIYGFGGVFNNLSQFDADGGQDALSIFATDSLFNNISIDGCVRGVDFEPGATGNTINNLRVANVSVNDAIRFNATADNNSICGGVVQAGKNVGDSASGTRIEDIRNWRTQANITSQTFLVDSTGTKVLTIAHGLNVTPLAEDVSLTVGIEPGGPTDWRTIQIQMDGNPSSSSIFARVVVGTASETTGATAVLRVQVRAKNS